MKSFNSEFYTQRVQSYLQEILETNGYQSDYSAVTFSQKCKLAALIIDAYPGSDMYECFVESDMIGNMLSIMRSLRENDRISSAKALQSNLHNSIVNYFNNTMEAMYERALSDYAEDYARGEAASAQLDAITPNDHEPSGYKPYHYRGQIA